VSAVSSASLYVTQDDLERLSQLLDSQGGRFAKLEGELARAKVVPRADIPRDVVTMNRAWRSRTKPPESAAK
jgi:hypothetical protein